MPKIGKTLRYLAKGISVAVYRFPLTVINLILAASFLCYMVSLHKTPPVMVYKFMFTFLFGAVLGMAAQFALERFRNLNRFRLLLYVAAVLLTAAYFLILLPSPEIRPEIVVRTFIAVFSMLCLVLWLPSFRDKTDFNKIALIHFKSVFTSLLYAAVLSGGAAAIIAAVDALLFNITRDAYSYMLIIVWVLFAPVYYLSLLPKFDPENEAEREMLERTEKYPKFLEILISYIAIPLIAAYTIVLFLYFVKILVTHRWPSGQLGPMVLFYSAVGLIVFVLSSLLENRFSVYYRTIFPKVWIPVVLMQLVSVSIRLKAYGVTESRYYVALFGIFSIASGVLLSIRPKNKNRAVALLAAGFALVSILPPADAFTVSRRSQIGRIESLLSSEGMLKDGKLTPNQNVAENVKRETTSILSYLNSRSSLKYVSWLPSDFNVYEDMKAEFGFDPVYGRPGANENKYFYIGLNTEKPINITGYDVSLMFNSEKSQSGKSSTRFMAKGVEYLLSVERLSKNDARVSVKNSAGAEMVGTELYLFVNGLKSLDNGGKYGLDPDKMTLETAKNGYRLKILFQNIGIASGSDLDSGVDYSAVAMFAAP